MYEQTQSISDVSVSLPPFTEVIEVLTLQAGYNSAIVVVGTTLLGIAAGAIGAFAVLRGRALMGDALAHSALPGLAAAFIFGSLLGIGGRHLWLLLLGAAISGVLGVVCVQLIKRNSRLHEDTAIGAVLSTFFGAGIVLLSLIQSLGTGEAGGLHHFIFGQTAAMNLHDAFFTLGAALICVGVCIALFKEFRLVCFDESFAASEGWPVSFIDLVMMTLVVAVTVIGLQAVGLLLIVALLIVPAAGARFWTNRLSLMVTASALIGGLSGYIGSSASALLPRLPAGAVIVLVAGAIFFISFFFAPERGVLSVVFAHLALKRRVAKDHFLRGLYELCEQRGLSLGMDCEPVRLDKLPLWETWPWWTRRLMLARMRRMELLDAVNTGGVWSAKFLPAGLRAAERLVRNHRLWEEYLLNFADIPISHVDYSADLAEHVLSPEIVARLEKSLKQRLGSLPGEPPRSVHPLGEGA